MPHTLTCMNVDLNITNVVQSIISLGLLFVTLIFVGGIIEEYREGSTYFSVSKQLLSNRDLPTATVCFLAAKELHYWSDFKVQTGTTWEATPNLIGLQNGMNEYYFFGSRIIFLKELVVGQYALPLYRSCISLSFGMREPFYMNMWGNTSHSLGLFVISFKVNLGELQIKEAILYMTSQRNSYGAVTLRWFDGQAKPLYLKVGQYQNIQIYKIKRYEFLKDRCKETSFYHCMGSNLAKSPKCKLGIHSCGPYSLPTTNVYSDFPICLNESKCHEHTDNIWTGKIDDCKNLIPCHVQVYEMQEGKVGPGMEKQPKTQNDSYMFYLDLDSPDGTLGSYSDELKVDVHTEHLAWTFKNLLGNIGGYLGLCVGFSFTGFTSWMLNMLPKVKQVLNQIW